MKASLTIGIVLTVGMGGMLFGQSAGTPRVPPGFKAKEGTAAEPYSNTGWAKEIVHEKTGLELVFIPAGEFMMGSRGGEKDRSEDEGPVHRVRITKGFYLRKYEVTQGEWEKVMGKNPSHFKGSARLPVETVSWDDVQDFCRRAGNGLRLPTEAEWEYACRAGTRTAFHTGDTISTDEVNYDGNYVYGDGRKGVYRQKTVEVGSLKPNAFGLYDMHGNVWEWCSDWYGEKYYGESPANDPQGPNAGTLRVVRGGSWGSFPWFCRSAYRVSDSPDLRSDVIGCRLALDLK